MPFILCNGNKKPIRPFFLTLQTIFHCLMKTNRKFKFWYFFIPQIRMNKEISSFSFNIRIFRRDLNGTFYFFAICFVFPFFTFLLKMTEEIMKMEEKHHIKLFIFISVIIIIHRKFNEIFSFSVDCSRLSNSINLPICIHISLTEDNYIQKWFDNLVFHPFAHA